MDTSATVTFQPGEGITKIALTVEGDVPGIDDHDYLQPKKMYERQGRLAEYTELVAKYNHDRREYLRKWKGLSEEIVKAI